MLVHRPETPDYLCPNEFEVETSALAPEDGAEAEAWRLIRRILHLLLPHMRLWRRVLAWSAMPLALLLVLSMIVAQTVSDQTTAASGAAPSALLQVHSPPLSLGAAPAYCLGRTTPQPVLTRANTVIGAAPVWAAGFDGPQATLHISDPDPATATRYGWIAPVLWKMAPAFSDVVFIQGKDLRSGAPLWLRIPNQAAAPLLVLDPNMTHAISADGKRWAEWQGEIYIAAASCYSLDAWWVGGHWSMIFAAGRGVEQVIPPEGLCRGQEAPCISGVP